MRHTIYTLLCIAILLMAGCTQGVLTGELDQVTAIMEEHPDSAYIRLKEMEEGMADEPTANRMRHRLLMAEACYKLDLEMPTDSAFHEVVAYYDRHGSANQRMKAHYLLGGVYQHMHEAPQALLCFKEAADCADTLAEDCDYLTLMKVYGQMGEIYCDQKMPEEIIKAFDYYIRCAKKIGLESQRINGIEHKEKAYFVMRDSANVMRLAEYVYQEYKRIGENQKAAISLPMAINLQLFYGNPEMARKLMEMFENESGLFDEDGNICKGWESYYESKGNYYLLVNHLDGAESYFRKLHCFGYPFEAYRGLIRVYEKKGIADSILALTERYEEAFEVFQTDLHAEAMFQTDRMYDYTRHQQQAAKNLREAQHSRTLAGGLLAAALAVTAAIVTYFRRRRREDARRVQQLSDKAMETLGKYNQATQDLYLVENDFEAYRKQKRAELESLNSELKDLKEAYGEMEKMKEEAAVYDSGVMERFRKMSVYTLGSSKPDDKDWEELVLLIKKHLPQYYHALTSQHLLTPQELRTCLLLRLGFSASDIVVLMDVTPQRVTNIKTKANRKLFDEKGAGSLDSNLQTL